MDEGFCLLFSHPKELMTMKKAAPVIAVVLALAAAGVAAYHFVETWPNVQAFQRMADEKPSDNSMSALVQSYRDAGFQQIYAMWGVAGLGVIFGALGAAKGKKKKKVLAIVGLLVSLGVLAASMTTLMSGRIG